MELYTNTNFNLFLTLENSRYIVSTSVRAKDERDLQLRATYREGVKCTQIYTGAFGITAAFEEFAY